MGFPDELDLPPNAKLIDDQTSIEYNIWNALHYQSDKIRTLEDQIWKLKEVTKFLRERTDSLSSFNTNWTVQSGSNSLASSIKPSGNSGNSTPPTTASSIRTAITSFTTNPLKLQEVSNVPHYYQSPDDFTSSSSNEASSQHFIPSTIKKSEGYSSSRTGTECSLLDREPLTSNVKTPQAASSPQNGAHSPSSSSFNQRSHSSHCNSLQSSYHSQELRRKHSGSKADTNGVESTVNTSQSIPNSSQVNMVSIGSGMVIARKPSLLTRRGGNPMQGIGSRSIRTGGISQENRLGGVWTRSSSIIMLPAASNDQLTSPKSSESDLKPLSSASINRSASTSNLRIANSTDWKPAAKLPKASPETSVRVKSSNDQTVAEVLSNHLITFHVNEPHAWAKHVLLLRINDVKEYCLSYDDIPLKVYRSFKSRDGVDFAIRSIDEIPSPIRLIGNSRKKSLSFELEEELGLSDDPSSSDELSRKAELERSPLSCGLAICGYQAESADEISIKAGESFKVRAHLKGRYLLERESNTISSPLSALNSANSIPSPSPTRVGNETFSENVGWVAENCILESTQSMRMLNLAGSSLKHLISSPMEGSSEYLDLENLTVFKICLISFQSQFITWSGELTKVSQGEKIRAFKHKTRCHWVYCLRESNGERGWLPKWILSDNLQVFSSPKSSASSNKLQTYLLQQSSHQLLQSKNKVLEAGLSRSQTMVLSRSASTPKRSAIVKPPSSPPSLRPSRSQRGQNVSLGSLGASIDRLSALATPKIPPESILDSSDQKTANDGAPLSRSATDGARSLNFTPRSRRSRISTSQES